MQTLKISEDKRHIVYADGTPFYWIGDTAWELFHRLSREEADLYLENRAALKFSVIQAVALAEYDGLTLGNAYGRVPLLQNAQGQYDPTLPDLEKNESAGTYTYWDHVDYIVDKAASLGIYIAMLPTWGDKYNKSWGKGPEIFTEENAYLYGSWLGKRYGDRDNIIWVLGGDRPLETAAHFRIVNEMARGIREQMGSRHLMTFHPTGDHSSAECVHDEPWLDFNMIQSGHGRENLDNYTLIIKGYEKEPHKPILDGEARYEEHPINFRPANGYFDAWDVRQAAYWAVFSGACGHTYGHNCVWIMSQKAEDYLVMTWKDALMRPGARQMQYVRKLLSERPFLDLVPDQELLASNYEGTNYLAAARGKDYLYVYSPNGLAISVRMGKIQGQRVKAGWYDPRTGEYTWEGQWDNTGEHTFQPPDSGRNCDWVLVLENADPKA